MPGYAALTQPTTCRRIPASTTHHRKPLPARGFLFYRHFCAHAQQIYVTARTKRWPNVASVGWDELANPGTMTHLQCRVTLALTQPTKCRHIPASTTHHRKPLPRGAFFFGRRENAGLRCANPAYGCCVRVLPRDLGRVRTVRSE